ncbi:hypothetical protein [Pengzhenrongella sicca]|uniref:Uncharacterized protein n=1 Tax=Pengzhenrongella sicca TaxID=2819238 RepID=A0A8A4ZGV3_9MICO|nr:hypothetical protein [Pengzhenrongella sicca]QTE30495.1 hypothetical protein J4E96_05825 [Pengzhenrongella sicca]
MSESHGWRPALALAWRWAVRAVTGYTLLVALLTLGAVLLAPTADWSRVGGLDSLLLSYAFWIVVLVPVLALAGVAEAAAVWLALRLSAGSTRVGAITAGIAGALIVMAFTLLYSEPRAVDAAGYAVGSAALGVVAARLTVRDVATIPLLVNWLDHLRR